VSRTWLFVLLAAVGLVAANGWFAHERPAAVVEATQAPPDPSESTGLPPEAIATLQAIANGGPFPYDRDGTVFQNREGLLPQQPRGYYREYTVETPGSRDRGARRIVTGGDPPEVYWYTEDHYRSFRRIEAAPP
jgi:ribonuclease T1